MQEGIPKFQTSKLKNQSQPLAQLNIFLDDLIVFQKVR